MSGDAAGALRRFSHPGVFMALYDLTEADERTLDARGPIPA